MARALLLTGEKKVGKTTGLRHIVDRIGAEHFTGFFATERRVAGRRTGFQIEMLDGRSGPLASIDSASDMRVGRVLSDGRKKYGVDLDFLDKIAVPELRSVLAEGRPERALLVDEIGPMQLYSSSFKQVILDALAGSNLLLGSIMLPSEPWVDDLKRRGDVETFLLTSQNRQSMVEMMALYLEQHLLTQPADRVS
ncbi:MAG TPA: nucleoside-triphosphatase [Streptosporangiaceae bacterium]